MNPRSLAATGLALGGTGALLLVTALAASNIPNAGPPSAAVPVEPTVLLMAEGGHAAAAPENTLASLRSAASAGFSRSWVDVRTTADGALVLLRDATLDRTTNCRGAVVTTTATTLAACDAGSWFDNDFAGEKVPPLADALALANQNLVLDLRAADAGAVLAAAEAAGMIPDVEMASDDVAVIRTVEAAHPEIPTWLRAAVLDDRSIAQATAAGADGVAAESATVTWATVALARRAGLEMAALGTSRGSVLHELVAMGVNRVGAPNAVDLAWNLGVKYRTYGGPEFDRNNEAGSNFPAALAAADFDHDGRADLALGAPSDSDGGRDAGWTGVTFGGDQFPNRVVSDPGDEPAGQWGSGFLVGDWNLDNFQDLAIGVPRRDFSGQDSGTVWLWDGSAGGVGLLSRPIRDIGAAGALDGSALAKGDFNADGVDDLVVGAPGLSLFGQTGAGQVALLQGREGAGPVSAGALMVDRTLDEVPGFVSDGDLLGSALATGDFDGDGYDDLAVSIPGLDMPDARDAGGVLLVYCLYDDENEAIIADRYEMLTRDDPNIPGDAERSGEFGNALASADFDRDGFHDLVIAVPAASVAGRRGAGELVVMYGHENVPGPARVETISADSGLIPGSADSGDGFGRVLSVADLNADGLEDLIVGVPEKNVGTVLDAGQVVAILAGVRGLDPRRSVEVLAGMGTLGSPAENRQELGQSVAVGDFNGDAVPDIAIGSVGQTYAGVREAGALLVAWGPNADLPGVPTATEPPPTMTPTATRTATPRATRTPLPRVHAYVPYAGRLSLLGRYPVPTLPPVPLGAPRR